jgi:hypothetical protein
MSDGPLNYFNYFTEIEEHFQRARGASLFLLSPLDWALIESWKNSDVPLEAVLRGIDAAFDKWRSRRSRAQMVNSLAFCSQAVMAEAQRMADGGQARASKRNVQPFAIDELRRYMESNAAAIRQTGIADFAPIAESLEQLTANLPQAADDLESLERRLTSLEEKMIAVARARQPIEAAETARRELDNYLRPYRGKMTSPHLAMLETKSLERAILDAEKLPHLSLFYLR